MRKLVTGATLLVFGAGISPSAFALDIKGSDTLEDVAKSVIATCEISGGLTPGAFNYIGGGSGGGQAAMTAVPPTQDFAPMSRELNGTACSATAQELLIGLDGIAIVGSQLTAGDSTESTASLADDCKDSIIGDKQVAVSDCSVAAGSVAFCDNNVTTGAGTYTFTSWKDVLAVVYAGQNHSTNAQLTAAKTRNKDRINCAGDVRKNLVNSWGTIFSDDGNPITCRQGGCAKLKHAFRRGDLSGTTDTFVGLVGLVAIPAFTTTSANNFPTKNLATATANPFCNAGEMVMNKGDSDYLDLDPIRRHADADNVGVGGLNRQGREQVAEGYATPVNSTVTTDPAIVVAGLQDFGAPNRQNVGPDPSNVNWLAQQQGELPKRQGLGVVLPVEIPTNYTTEDQAYWGGAAPAICTPGIFAPSLPDTAPAGICPDGTTGLCALPVACNDAACSAPSFNCLSAAAKPSNPPILDNRVFNLLVLTSAGKYVYDNYTNPSVTLPATRQRRVVSAFFRLHSTQTTSFEGGVSTGGPCRQFTSTDQIGCLVKANPCSIGFAGREAVSAGSMAFELGTLAALNDSFPPSNARVNNLVLTATKTDDYPLARALWVNVANTANINTPDETAVMNCFGLGGSTSIVDGAISSKNFIPVPSGVSRVKTCPATFP